MGMDIDEPRRHHMAGGVDGLVAGDLGLCDDGDSAVPDADVGDAIEHRLRVHDPTVVDDKIVFCGKCMCRKNQRKKYICRGKIILSRHIFFLSYQILNDISSFLIADDALQERSLNRLPAHKHHRQTAVSGNTRFQISLLMPMVVRIYIGCSHSGGLRARHTTVKIHGRSIVGVCPALDGDWLEATLLRRIPNRLAGIDPLEHLGILHHDHAVDDHERNAGLANYFFPYFLLCGNNAPLSLSVCSLTAPGGNTVNRLICY